MVQDWYGNPQANVQVKVQGYNTTTGTFSFLSELLGLSVSQTPILTQNMSGMTGQDGAIDFILDPSVSYKMDFTKGTAINLSWQLYPKEDYYLLAVPPSSASVNAVCSNINSSLTHTPYNATYESLGLNYNDPSGSTTLVNFYVQDINRTYLNLTSSTASTWIPSYNVNSSFGNTYFWGFNASSGACSASFGNVQVITFKNGGRLIDLHFKNTNWYQIVSVSLIVFVAALFSAKKVKFGSVVLPLFSAMLYVFGWFSVNPIILASAIVIGILVYLRMSEVKTNY
jgi:hypothetical protein